MEVKPVYLVMITEQNNNKYYNCFPNGDGTFTVKYGRVGGHETTASYLQRPPRSRMAMGLERGRHGRAGYLLRRLRDCGGV